MLSLLENLIVTIGAYLFNNGVFIIFNKS